MNPLIFGVLALQGGFAKHLEMLRALDVQAIEVRTPAELAQCHALVIPGGESTTMMKQIAFIGLEEPLKEFAKHKPLFGTCAGLILMSDKIIADKMEPLHLLQVAVERNAFGRQAESFQTHLQVTFEQGKKEQVAAVFIRAPRIRELGENVKVLSYYEDEAVLIQQGMHLGATFHPELTSNNAIHAYFIKLVKKLNA